MFFFLLSALLAAAASRAESRYSRRGSKSAYALAIALSLAALLGRFWGRQEWFVADFFEGILLSIVILGAAWAVTETRFSAGIDAAFFATLSLLLGVIAVARAVPAGARPADGISAHTFFMFLSLAAFSLSFLFSILFLAQDFLLKRKKAQGFFSRLPPLELTARLNFSFLTVGTASLFAGVLGGLLYRRAALSGFFVLEPTPAMSFLALALYAGVLMLRRGPLERGRNAAWVTVASYPFLLAVFLAVHPAGAGGGA